MKSEGDLGEQQLLREIYDDGKTAITNENKTNFIIKYKFVYFPTLNCIFGKTLHFDKDRQEIKLNIRTQTTIVLIFPDIFIP